MRIVLLESRVVSKNSPSETRPVSEAGIRGFSPATLNISGAHESSNASPQATTGVPNKSYRGAQQGSGSASRPLTPPRRANKPKTCPTRPCDTPRATYRGPQQILPGCPTRTTGVPNKKYRGAQQEALSKIAAKWGFLCRVSGLLCFCLSCSVMLLNNNYRENGEVTRGD
jgi:hypothetical protein